MNVSFITHRLGHSEWSCTCPRCGHDSWFYGNWVTTYFGKINGKYTLYRLCMECKLPIPKGSWTRQV